MFSNRLVKRLKKQQQTGWMTLFRSAQQATGPAAGHWPAARSSLAIPVVHATYSALSMPAEHGQVQPAARSVGEPSATVDLRSTPDFAEMVDDTSLSHDIVDQPFKRHIAPAPPNISVQRTASSPTIPPAPAPAVSHSPNQPTAPEVTFSAPSRSLEESLEAIELPSSSILRTAPTKTVDTDDPNWSRLEEIVQAHETKTQLDTLAVTAPQTASDQPIARQSIEPLDQSIPAHEPPQQTAPTRQTEKSIPASVQRNIEKGSTTNIVADQPTLSTQVETKSDPSVTKRLNEVWPVEIRPKAIQSKLDEDPTQKQLNQSGPTVHESREEHQLISRQVEPQHGQDAVVESYLKQLPTGQPTQSVVDFMPPRSRPKLQRSSPLSPPPSELAEAEPLTPSADDDSEGDMSIEAKLTPVHEPISIDAKAGASTPAIQAQRNDDIDLSSPVSSLKGMAGGIADNADQQIETEVGALPADLWSLIGESPPHLSQVPKLGEISNEIASSTEDPRTIMPNAPNMAAKAGLPPIDPAGFTSQLSVPSISSVPSPTMPSFEMPLGLTSTSGQTVATPSAITEAEAMADDNPRHPDLDDIAATVYQEIKSRLKREQERLGVRR